RALPRRAQPSEAAVRRRRVVRQPAAGDRVSHRSADRRRARRGVGGVDAGRRRHRGADRRGAGEGDLAARIRVPAALDRSERSVMYFPQEEYEARWDRVHAAMRAQGLSAALVWQRSGGGYEKYADVYYLTHYYSSVSGQADTDDWLGRAFAAVL